MADNRKYYYLKLKENFYDSEEMILLQNMQDGYLYSDILMKLYLRSLKNNGKLMFKDVIPYTPQLLAQVVRHQVGTVKQALQIFQELGLIELMDSGAIYMLDIQNFIGESSTEADRQRKYYNKIKAEKQLEIDSKEECKKSYIISTPEKEIEKEIEIKIDIEKEIENNNEQSAIAPVLSKSSKSGLSKQYQKEFETLWEHYPNKKGKDQAKNKYFTCRKQGVTYEEVVQGLKNYIAYIKAKNIEDKYIKHGSTWFNQKCWNDDYSITNNTEVKKDEQMEILKGVYNGTIEIN